MFLFRSFLLVSLVASLTSCGVIFNGINAVGVKYFPDEYEFTKADGTTYRAWLLTKDRKNKLKADSVFLQQFDSASLAVRDTTSRRRTHMELTVTGLKTLASQNQYTIFVERDPGCGGSIDFTTGKTFPILKQLSSTGIKFNQGHVGLVFGSLTYQFSSIDYWFNKWHYPFQSYIIPATPYSHKIILKDIAFKRELYPEGYIVKRDDIWEYKIFLLDNTGKVVDKVAYLTDEAASTAELNRFVNKVKTAIL